MKVTGNLSATANNTALAGTLDVMLCGYGSQVPRVNGVAILGKLEQTEIPAPGGTFSFTVIGNDLITPAGTYYTLTVRDDNGDIAQVNAYVFYGQSDINLNTQAPFDPSAPPPPVPTPVENLLLAVPASADMVFDGTDYTSFITGLPGDVEYPTIQNMQPGNLYTFIIVQDAVGRHLFYWPPGVFNGSDVDRRGNVATIQTFVCDEVGQLWAIAPATVRPWVTS